MNRSDPRFENKSKARHPFDEANGLSKFFYWWLRDLFKIGSSRQITDDDLYGCVDDQKSDRVSKNFEKFWNREMEKMKPSLMRVIANIFLYKVGFVGFLFGLAALPCKLLSPLLMGYLIAYFMTNPYNHTEQQAYLFATGLAVSQILTVITFHPCQLYFFQSSLKLRVACCSMIYKKILSLKKYSMKDGLAGQAINLMSNDVSRFDLMVCFIDNVWMAPLGSLIAGYLIYTQVEYAGLIGLSILVFSMPIQTWLSKKAAEARLETATKTDARVKFMFSVLKGVQIVKMYAWERSFGKVMQAIRKAEVKVLGKTANIRAAQLSFHVSTQIAIFLSLMSYVLLGNEITAQKAFVMIAYFNYINHELVEYWPLALTCVAEGIVSVKRVEEFLVLNNACDREETETPQEKESGEISMQNATAYWDQDSSSSAGISLDDLKIGNENLTVIVGQVGSGKTTLLEVILKELPLVNGRINVNGSISYAAQQSWIFEGSIKNNIVFTSNFDEKRYKAVVHACALERDFELLPHSDETIVGDRGISLSGGQKARVNLARAIYKTADIYLLDDPLSAVDVHVGKHIFEKCIRGFLKDKTCVLVTHQLQYLQGLKHIVLMKNGRIQTQGSFDEVKSSDPEFKVLVEKSANNKENDDQEKKSYEEVKNGTKTEVDEQIIAKEGQQSGKVSRNVYKSYIKAVNSFPYLVLVALLLITAQALNSGVNFFVSIWVNWEETHRTSQKVLSFGISIFEASWWTTNRHIYFYTGGIVVLTVIAISAAFGFYRMSLRICKILHDQLFHGVIRAKMVFFNSNSSGRILNRFSKDTGAIDSQLPVVVIDCIKFFLELFGIVTIVSIVNFWLIIPTGILFAVFIVLRKIFLKTARDVKRIEAITRSPMFTHLTATIEGLTTVRAFKAEDQLIAEYDHHQDVNSSAWFLFVATSRGFAFYVDFMSSLYITCIIYSFLVLGTNTIGSNIGLAITQAINLIGLCNWGLRQTAELENQMTSVERVVEYTNLPRERDLDTKPEILKSLPESWGSKGAIKFTNVSLKYSEEGSNVLHNLNFSVQEREKIGIVGRTGAGKSSITQAIFQLAFNDGVIEIDNVDINSLGLHTFRQIISIIPQDPVLFVGSLRQNLDPMNEKSDDDVWKALEQVQLKEPIKQLTEGIHTKVAESGSNFSSGQRQLICLARAILKQNKILIMDEATANIDTETDNLIQATIRSQFSDCTVLTVAHRINTVIDSDRILVLDAGKIIEFDTPTNLLKDSQGCFYKLVREAGLNTEKVKSL